MRTPVTARRTHLRALAPALFAAALLLAPVAHARPAAPATPAVDVSGWQSLLDQYLVRIAAPRQPFDVRFDYVKLYVDEDIWTQQASSRLAAVRAQLFAADPGTLSKDERLAWALNAYNFLVVERATLHLLVPNRKFLRYTSVDEMNYSDGTFFDAPVVTIAGRPLSLNAFERVYVYGEDTPPSEPRRAAADPRLLFALCRGSIGSPPLPARAFKPESLQVQLDQAARTALALPRFTSFDPATQQLLVSEFLNRARVDFGGEPALIAFVGRFGPDAARNAIRKGKVTVVTRYMSVDPLLNQWDRPKPAAPSAGAKPE